MSPNLFCPGCGHGLPAGVAFCPACGNPAPAPAPQQTRTQETPDQDVTIRDLGQPYRWMETPSAPPRPVVPLQTAPPPPPPAYQPPTVRQNHIHPCPGCGQLVSRAAAFCPQCGRNLHAPHAAAAHAPPPAAALASQSALSFSQRSAVEQLLIVVLAILAACIILMFFC